MGTFKAYFDDSWGIGAMAIVGYVASIEQWIPFERAWKGVCDDFGVHDLHMKDFTVSTGQYEKWKGDEKTRREFLEGLLSVLSDSEVRGVSASVPFDELAYFNKLSRDSIQAYPFAVSRCIAELCNIEGRNPIECIFDRPPVRHVSDVGGALQCAGEYLANDPGYADWWSQQFVEMRPLHGKLSVADIPAFQPADFAAWEIRERVERQFNLHVTPKPVGGFWTKDRLSLIGLGRTAMCQGTIWAIDDLREWDERRRRGSCLP